MKKLKRQTSGVSASVTQRLRNINREKREDFNLLLRRYAIERLLYRLSLSEYQDQFVLKGALLFLHWMGELHRPTRDVDMLGFGDSSETTLKTIFTDIAQIQTQDDGLFFDLTTIHAEEIREDQVYAGQRIHMIAYLGQAKIPLQIDIGFGDAITPDSIEIEYPTLLDFDAPRLLIYPRETVVAEKLEAMVTLGIANSRMKDFYDVWLLAQTFTFESDMLVNAIEATFGRRQTAIPTDEPFALTDEFARDANKINQWKAFLNRNRLDAPPLDQVIQILREFVLPILILSDQANSSNMQWQVGGPWLP